METQTEEPKQSPNQTTTTKTTKETKQNNTIDLLNPMSGYVQHTSPTAQMPSNDGKIIEVLWQLKKLGKAKDTIDNARKCLYVLKKHANLDNPDSVVSFVATYERNAGYKRNLIMAYEHYVKQYGLTWIKPRYHENAKMPKIPLEAKIETIMSNAPLKLRTAIGMSKDTGMRPIELMRLTYRNLDLQNGVVYPETAKGGSPRVLKLKNATLKLLNWYMSAYNVDLNGKLFGKWNSEQYGKMFRVYRDKAAHRLQDPTLKTIRLYDLRHLFATMTYHRTKDILYTKQQMGHRKIETTLIYTARAFLQPQNQRILHVLIRSLNSHSLPSTDEAQKTPSAFVVENYDDYQTSSRDQMLNSDNAKST